MRAFLFLLALLLASPAFAFSHGIVTVPAECAAAGDNTLVYNVQAFSSANVDTGLSYAPGYAFYLFNGNYGNGAGQITPDPTTIVFNADRSVNIGASPFNGNLTTASCTSSACTNWVGSAFGGGHGYCVQAEFSYPQFTGTGSVWMAFWSWPVEAMTFSSAIQWPGQATGYLFWVEPDYLENFGNNGNDSTYQSATHDWYGTSTCKNGTTYCFDGNSPNITTPNNPFSVHVYSGVYVPSTGGSSGSITEYLDGVQTQTQTWSQFTFSNCQNSATQCPPPVGVYKFGAMDYEHVAMLFGGRSNAAPLTLYWLRVWCASTACMVTQ